VRRYGNERAWQIWVNQMIKPISNKASVWSFFSNFFVLFYWVKERYSLYFLIYYLFNNIFCLAHAYVNSVHVLNSDRRIKLQCEPNFKISMLISQSCRMINRNDVAINSPGNLSLISSRTTSWYESICERRSHRSLRKAHRYNDTFVGREERVINRVSRYRRFRSTHDVAYTHTRN